MVTGRGIKDYRYTELNSGKIIFDTRDRNGQTTQLRDQKGRAIGYQWRIYRVTIELMSDEEYRAARWCSVLEDGAPTEFIEARTTTTRDDIPYGPSTSRMRAATEDEAYMAILKRADNACKANTKKFAVWA